LIDWQYSPYPSSSICRMWRRAFADIPQVAAPAELHQTCTQGRAGQMFQGHTSDTCNDTGTESQGHTKVKCLKVTFQIPAMTQGQSLKVTPRSNVSRSHFRYLQWHRDRVSRSHQGQMSQGHTSDTCSENDNAVYNLILTIHLPYNSQSFKQFLGSILSILSYQVDSWLFLQISI